MGLGMTLWISLVLVSKWDNFSTNLLPINVDSFLGRVVNDVVLEN
jgi:hypothetical protein